VLLLVHDTKPPFLQGKALSGKAAGVVLPLKDPTSDMAVHRTVGSQAAGSRGGCGPIRTPQPP